MRDPLYPARALRFTGGDAGHEATRMLPEETAVALVYDGVTHAVMMASPSDLEDFVTGFSLTEGIVRGADEIRTIAVEPKDEGVIVTILTDAGWKYVSADFWEASDDEVAESMERTIWW